MQGVDDDDDDGPPFQSNLFHKQAQKAHRAAHKIVPPSVGFGAKIIIPINPVNYKPRVKETFFFSFSRSHTSLNYKQYSFEINIFTLANSYSTYIPLINIHP